MGKGRRGLVAIAVTAMLCTFGCHAAEDDAAGQAGELSDPVRRENAIFNLNHLYVKALSDNRGDRNSADVKALSDTIVEPLTRTYVDASEDRHNGLAILNLLQEIRDPRSLDALTAALKWRRGVSEEHAIRAAQTIRMIDVPDAKKAGVVSALAEALGKVTDARTEDNKMRIEMIRAIGSLRDRSATEILAEIATKQDEKQNFLINRLAAQQLGELKDPAAIPALVQSLFIAAPNRPDMRMNDVAAEALVRIGKPALKPLLGVLRGQDKTANAAAKQYIEALAAKRPDVAGEMSVRQLTGTEGSFALGALGFDEALGPLLKESSNSDMTRKLNAAIAMVRLNVSDGDRERVRAALKSAYGALPKGYRGVAMRSQLLAAMAHTYDASLTEPMLTEMSNKRAHPDLRLIAAQYYALLANKAQADTMRGVIKSESKSEAGGYREKFQAHKDALKAADECDKSIGCWIEKSKKPDASVARKATYMLGRYAKGRNKAIDALVEQLGSQDLGVRLGALMALDRIATKGSPEAVEKIDELRQREEGRSIWTRFRQEALPVQARLRSRAGG